MRWSLLLVFSLISWSLSAAEPTPEGIEFFEKKIRPILVESCVRCHGEKKQQAELRLDTAEGLAKGADTGAVVGAGDPEKSKLILSVRRVGDSAMPPDKALPKEQVEALAVWVKMGAPFPKSMVKKPSNTEIAAKHWAFQPILDPAVPKLRNSSNPIDQFVLQKLANQKLTFAPPAEKATLIRRAYYDLIGLPPTAEQVEAFVADTSPKAFEKVVDELLSSPHYGERWGRYWLDLARYADTKGYVFQEDRNYPHAYTYRDYVIRSLNEDKPYNVFVKEQLAADLLPTAKDTKTLAALGFLTVGRRFINNIHDIIDDRIDVVTRGLMGVTAQCARCHDHKFDPIGIADYYSLYAIFNSSTEPKELPLIGEFERTEAYVKYEAEVQKREAEIMAYREKRYTEILAELRQPETIKKYLALAEKAKAMPGPEANKLARDENLRPAAFDRYREQLKKPEKDRIAPTAKGGPTDVPFADFDRLILRDDRDKLIRMRQQVDKFIANSAFNPARAMVVQDKPNPSNIRVFQRGNPGNPGAEVPRQFLQIGTLTRTPVNAGSGRKEMAEAIVAPTNPLTARVIVNRVWLNHFGQGLVSTASDFGLRSEPPTHPELLDWLATRFTNDDGWSLKKLHRRMMLSRVYQQSSVTRPEALERDPENRLLSRMSRRRLDFEALRDSLLVAGGQLDRTVYGRSVDLFKAPYTTRRSVYGSIDRQNLPGTFRAFDFASPEQHSPGRFTTTVPQQALYLMNSPFASQQAKAVIARPHVGWAMTFDEKTRRIYRAVLQRNPTPTELTQAREFLGDGEKKPWESLAQVLLWSNEFAFVD
ncbi:MAG: PSD1 and planctomycete cytochrome C domain-containing protein [Fimbriiglobus sp.]